MRKLAVVFGFLLLAFAGTARADLVEGRHFVTLASPQPTEAKGKIEVVEFFWFGCSHCYRLEPYLQAWLKTLPKDVVFRRVPAVYPRDGGKPGPWGSGAQLYYALDSLGLLPRLEEQVFDAIQRDRVNLLFSQGKLLEWMAARGVDQRTFSDTYNSFSVGSKVLAAQQQYLAYGFDGVPALAVDGRYGVINQGDDAQEQTLAIVNQLIAKARKEHGKK